MLVVIATVAAMLRLLGITWGLPGPTHLFSYQPDEFFSLQAALNLALNGDPNPHFFNYPSLYLYLSAAACMFGHGKLAMGDPAQQLPEILRAFTLDARLATVGLALITVGAVYAAATRLAGQAAGLVAAALVAVAPGHVLYSHFAAVDVPLACFMALAVWAAIALMDDDRWKIVILAAVACGASAATKYNGALSLLAPFLALGGCAWRSPRPRAWRSLVLRAAMLVFLGAVTFAVLSPYVFLDWNAASRDIAFEISHMRKGEYPAKAAYPSGAGFHLLALTYSFGGIGPLVGVGLLMTLGIISLRTRSLPVVVLAVAWFGMISATEVRYARYDLPLVPLVAILAAAGAVPKKSTRPGMQSIVARVIVVTLIPSVLVVSCLLSGSMSFLPEPRDAALQGILMQVPEQQPVTVLRTVWFDMPPLDFNNGGDALGRMFASFRRPLRPLRLLPGFDSSRLRREQPEWIVETDFQTAEWLAARNPAAVAFRNQLEADYLCQSFRRSWGWWLWGGSDLPQPHDFSYPFTTVRIWRLRASEGTSKELANYTQ